MDLMRRYKLDENSSAVKMLRQNKHIRAKLDGEAQMGYYRERAASAGVSFDALIGEAVKRIAKDDNDARRLMAVAYMEDNILKWCKYQQTYIISYDMLSEYGFNGGNDATSLMQGIKLPFTTIFAIVEGVENGRGLGFIMTQREDDEIDVSVLIGNDISYFRLNESTLMDLNQWMVHYFDELSRDAVSSSATFFKMVAIAFSSAWMLSVYRKEREIYDVNKIHRKGKPKKEKAGAVEWKFGEKETVKELPAARNDVDSAFKVDGLISPSERPDELVVPQTTHASPERHVVEGHTQVYWCGPGRKIPVVKTKASYERGGQEGDPIRSKKQKCKSKSK